MRIGVTSQNYRTIAGGCGDGFVRKKASRGVKAILTGESEPVTAVNKFVHGQRLKPEEERSH